MSGALTTIDNGTGDGSPPASRPSGPGAVPRALTRPQKAAIIVRLLLAEGVKLSLADLPEGMQAELTRQMAEMRFVDRVTLKSVVDEFVHEIEQIGLSFPGGLEGALAVLDGTISASTAARIRKFSGVRLNGDPWDRITGADPDRLLPILEEESVEVAAVLLSKLRVPVAADLLGRLPGPRARQITYAVSLTGGISPEVVERIGRSLAEQLDAQPPSAFDSGPVERVGAILNSSPAATRDAVLEGLEQDDATFADQVRKTIFTFENIPDRVNPRDVPRITRAVEPAVLVTALAAATGPLTPTRDFLLGAMSKRLAEQVREEIEMRGMVRPSEGEAAMNTVVAVIRDMADAGEVEMIVEDDTTRPPVTG